MAAMFTASSRILTATSLTSSLTLAILGLAGCTGGPLVDSGSGTGLVCEPGPMQRVLGGTPTSGFEAVVAVNEIASSFCERTGRPICTGTVIGPRTVLTAAHCRGQLPPELMGVVIGPRASYGQGPVGDQLDGVWFTASSATMHPDFDSDVDAVDLMLLHFDADLPVTPMGTTMLDDSAVGGAATVVGYGGQADTEQSVKQEGVVVVSQLDAAELTYTPDPAMTCSGDSGGPVLFDVSGTWMVGAVTVRGDAACEVRGVGPRLDAQLDFLAGR